MNNWKDYIDHKFDPTDEFIFTTEADSTSLTIKHKKTGTTFYFYWPTEDWLEISDIQYRNDKTMGWSGEYNRDCKFSNEEVKFLDGFLYPAFESGWMSKDIYLFNKHWKSQIYFNHDKSGLSFSYFSSALGCLSFILFPVSWLLELLFGYAKTVTIDPVNKYM